MKYKYILPSLPYPYDALEPYLDAKTMEIHHTKHHQTYVDKLNAALENWPEGQAKTLEELLRNLESIPSNVQTAIRNHGGGHFNHTLFWQIMSPPDRHLNNLSQEFLGIIEKNFGDFMRFKDNFTQAALNIFGSGWAWLVTDSSGRLLITTTSNQDTPISVGQIPILVIDVWEHAYYLKYQNRRAEYLQEWWKVVNWVQVEANFKKIKEMGRTSNY